jgi:hypothetical protein
MVLTALVMNCGQLLAAGLFGPSSPISKTQPLSFGPAIFFYNGEMDNGLTMRQTQPYGQLSYALTKRLEIYAQGGVADLKVEDFYFQGADLEDGYRPFGAFGFKYLLSDRQPFGLGFFARGAVFSKYEDTAIIDGNRHRAEVSDTFTVDGGLILQTVIEDAYIYGGPLFFLREGDINRSVNNGPTLASSFEEDSNFGGLVGIRWPLKNDISIDLEAQYRTRLSGGAAIHFSF